jgi:hypothetical protein
LVIRQNVAMKARVPRPPRKAVPRSRQETGRRRLYVAAAAAAAVLIFGLLYLVRPLSLIHGPLLYWYTQPVAFLLPGLAAVAGGWWSWKRTAGHPWRTLGAILAIGFCVWLPVATWSHLKVENALFEHSAFVEAPALPQRVAVAVLPRLIADQMVQSAVTRSGYTTPTGHIVFDRKTRRLAWTYELAPGSVFNRLFRPSRGIIRLDAEQSERTETHLDREFTFAPGMHVSQNTSWQILKRHYWSEPTDPVPVVTAAGEPLFVVPYLGFKGFLFRRPVVRGVMVFHPDGRIEDLSVARAAQRPEIVATGRLFPRTLARRVQDSYKFKRGLLNTLVGHRDQTQIDDDDASGHRMPYLMAFNEKAGTHLKWVSAAEPYGRAFATKAIFLTDAITGRTEVWQAREHSDLTGPARSIQTVRGLPGIVWTNFNVVEPRPAFVKGRLQYMLSIVPSSPEANTVSKTVFVDAASNKIAAIFNHDDPAVNADAEVEGHLATGGTTPTRSPDRPGENPLLTALELQLRSDRELIAKIVARDKRIEQLIEAAKDTQPQKRP